MKKLFLLFLLLPLLTACQPNKDISDIAFLLAVGIDGDMYTMQFANPVAFSGENASDNRDAVVTYSVNADNLNSALNYSRQKLLKTPDTSYLKLIVFSPSSQICDTARAFLKSPRFHPDIYVAVANEPSKYLEALNNDVQFNPIDFYDNLFSPKYNQTAASAVLGDFDDDISVLSVVGDISGIAVFDGKNVNLLKNNSYGLCFNILLGKVKSIDLNSGNAAVRLAAPILLSPSIDGNNITFDLKFKGEVMENKFEKSLQQLSEDSAEKLSGMLAEFLNECYSINGYDVLNLKKYYKKFYLTNEKYAEFLKTFNEKELKFKINISVEITKDGVLLNEN